MSLSDLRNLLDSSINFNRRYYRRNANRRNQQRIQRQRRRIIIRMYRRRVTANNTDTLRRISQLPLQITNDLFTNQMFNGSPF
jgi:hypothetical protein